MTRITATLYEDLYTFLSHLAHFSQNDKCFKQSSIENQNTHFMLNKFFFHIIILIMR